MLKKFYCVANIGYFLYLNAKNGNKSPLCLKTYTKTVNIYEYFYIFVRMKASVRISNSTH